MDTSCDCSCDCQALRQELEETKARLKHVRTLLHGERVRHIHLVDVMRTLEAQVAEAKDRILKWPVEAEEVEND